MILAVIGTRPEVIKMAPVIHALRQRGLEVQLVATGQHHDVRMMGSFLDSFGLQVDHRLGLVHRDLLGSFVEILGALATVFAGSTADMALAVGDTTTVLATALAARKRGIAFGHVEAGLRAFSRELPEEEHRICADAIGDLLFAPTHIAADNLLRERVNGAVILTGNPILDALRSQAPLAVARGARAATIVTIHRQETVDSPRRLAAVLAALRQLSERQHVEWPLHPRTRNKLAEYRLEIPPSIHVTEPIGHARFLEQLVSARLVVTDSGGVQEEAAILGTPCVCVRQHTERPETIAAGVGVLAGTETAGILSAVERVLANWDAFARPMPQLYGDGHAGDKIAAACAAFLGESAAQRPSSSRLASGIGG
jgi:UDP-N-acetylglucosamine 2-epimerase (non-hydrolysing)